MAIKGSAKRQSRKKAPELAVSYYPIAALIPYAKNARTHSEPQIEAIERSLLEFGWTNPVLLNGSKGILAGHGRILAAQKLWAAGKEIARTKKGDVPCIDLGGLTHEQQKAYIIADNQIAIRAGWNEELLAGEIQSLKIDGFPVVVLGFSVPDLNSLLTGPTGGRADEDDAPPAPKAPVSRGGDVWILGAHRLVCGDATKITDVQLAVAGATPMLMVTDPPYGVSYDPAWRARAGVNLNNKKLGRVSNDDMCDWRDAWALFGGDVAYVWHAGLHAAAVQESLESVGFNVRCQIIWAKDRFVLSRGDYHWQHEPCWYSVRNGATGRWAGDRAQSTLWTIKAREDGGHGHGTQKPVECMRRPILNNSMPGELVYEPFSGSGTTIIACEDTDRKCAAIELDPGYVDVAVLRWQNFTGEEATLDGDGSTFAQISEKRTPKKSLDQSGASAATA